MQTPSPISGRGVPPGLVGGISSQGNDQGLIHYTAGVFWSHMRTFLLVVKRGTIETISSQLTIAFAIDPRGVQRDVD